MVEGGEEEEEEEESAGEVDEEEEDVGSSVSSSGEGWAVGRVNGLMEEAGISPSIENNAMSTLSMKSLSLKEIVGDNCLIGKKKSYG